MKKNVLSGFLKKQIFAITSCVIVLVIGTILISSAAFTSTANENKNQTVTTGNFSVAYTGGSKVTGEMQVLSDLDGVATSPYTFTVKNNGSLEIEYEILVTAKKSSIDHNLIKISLDGKSTEVLGQKKIKSQDAANTTYIVGVYSMPNGSKNYSLRAWIDETLAKKAIDLGNTTMDTITSKSVDLSVQVQAVTPDLGNGRTFYCTGGEQTFTVPYAGTYEITAVGAGGQYGNTFSYTFNSSAVVPGKGALITAKFNLNKNDKLHLVVGCTGMSYTGTQKDGAAGAGGGGSFIFKEISSVSNTNYQFTKGSTNYETLLVAAGGNGTKDLGYSSGSGYDGNASAYKTIATKYSNNRASADSMSIRECNGSSSGCNSTISPLLSVQQYIYNGLLGGYYTRNNSVCQGGYGGGSCSDDGYSYGGGWVMENNAAYSFSSSTISTNGSNGVNATNGYVTIKKVG